MAFKQNLTRELTIFKEKLDKHAENSQSIITLFGIFGAINYPLFYLFWKSYSDSGYDDVYPRSIATTLCIILALNNYWPYELRKILSVYWYLTVTYCLPFYGTYAFLMNHASYNWTLNIILGLFWLVIVLDWVSFAIILPIGSLSGVIFYSIVEGSFQVSQPNVVTTLINVLWVIVTSLLFVRRKEIFNKEKLETMKILTSSIAHELRTPLRAIALGASGLKKFLPPLLETYQAAITAKLQVPLIDPVHSETLMKVPENIEQEARASFFFIDMLLIKLSKVSDGRETKEAYSIADCIEIALKRYPLRSKEKELVHWNAQNDFQFKGDHALMVHVIFNLIRNALYYIQVAKKGEIQIWLEKGQKENILHFKDTGAGIPSDILPHIFESFYTTTKHGTGIGLAFCKSVLHGFDGEIECISEEGKYTDFIIKFPNIYH